MRLGGGSRAMSRGGTAVVGLVEAGKMGDVFKTYPIPDIGNGNVGMEQLPGLREALFTDPVGRGHLVNREEVAFEAGEAAAGEIGEFGEGDGRSIILHDD